MPKSATFDDFPGLHPGDENYRARMLLELCSAEIGKAVGVRVIDGGDIAVLAVHPEMRALAILALEAIVGTKNLTHRERAILLSVNSLGVREPSEACTNGSTDPNTWGHRQRQ